MPYLPSILEPTLLRVQALSVPAMNRATRFGSPKSLRYLRFIGVNL